MDSGMDMPDQDSVLDAFDPLSFTSPEEIIWIMDQMLCFEVSKYLNLLIVLVLIAQRCNGMKDILCHKQYSLLCT